MDGKTNDTLSVNAVRDGILVLDYLDQFIAGSKKGEDE